MLFLKVNQRKSYVTNRKEVALDAKQKKSVFNCSAVGIQCLYVYVINGFRHLKQLSFSTDFTKLFESLYQYLLTF